MAKYPTLSECIAIQEQFSIGEALDAIKANKEAKALNYCVNYAGRASEMLADLQYSEKPLNYDFRVQLTYVLSNMVSWRGETAKKVRETIKACMRQYDIQNSK